MLVVRSGLQWSSSNNQNACCYTRMKMAKNRRNKYKERKLFKFKRNLFSYTLRKLRVYYSSKFNTECIGDDVCIVVSLVFRKTLGENVSLTFLP